MCIIPSQKPHPRTEIKNIYVEPKKSRSMDFCGINNDYHCVYAWRWKREKKHNILLRCSSFGWSVQQKKNHSNRKHRTRVVYLLGQMWKENACVWFVVAVSNAITDLVLLFMQYSMHKHFKLFSMDLSFCYLSVRVLFSLVFSFKSGEFFFASKYGTKYTSKNDFFKIEKNWEMRFVVCEGKNHLLQHTVTYV